MRKNNNNQNRNMKHRGGSGGGGGGRRFQGGGNRHNDGQNIARQKHHATQMREKYNNLARDAQNNGDRVDVEYYLQHVDHYNRVLTDIAAIEAERFAHQREQQPAPQEQQASAEGAPAADAAATDSGSTAGDAAAEPQPVSNQPRMTRQRRSPQPAASDNGAAEANSNTSEIPLPGSVLSQI